MSEAQRNLWAPWRMEYIDGLADEAGCFLCRALASPAEDEKNLVLWRSPATLVLLNRFPYSSGHLLVAPAAHVGGLEQLSDEVLLELLHRTRDAKRVLEAGLRAQGFNIGLNLGRCAGAGLPDHVHLHVVPRWGGDTNFMPVIGDVKVIPQALAATRQALLEAARRLGLPPA